jgi:N-acetylmuramoyl-L-alanine amidase
MQLKAPHFMVIFTLLILFLLALVTGSENKPSTIANTATRASLNINETALAFNSATPTPVPPTSTPVPPAHIVVIDPGHGADDWGTFHSDASGKPDLLEKEVVLKIGRKVADHIDPTIKVVLTRTTDISPNTPPQDFNHDGKIDQVDDLQARINIANQNKGDLFLSLHINSSELGNDVSGLETWYTLNRPFGLQSKKFAQLIQDKSLESLNAVGYKAQNRRVEDDLKLDNNGEHIFVLGPNVGNHTAATNMPGALAETLFISNDHEAALLADAKVQDKLASGFANAIEEYFANP